MSTIKLSKKENIKGIVTVAADKSISHRSIMLGAIANGVTTVHNFLMSDDSLATIDCFIKMGIDIKIADDVVYIYGKGKYGLNAYEGVLDAKNSGTTIRLLSGILSGQNFTSTISGDASLQKRPMERVITPLAILGAKIDSNNSYCPISFSPSDLKGISYELPIPSAQLKSAIILSALYAKGKTIITEEIPSRNHTEIMLKQFGCEIKKVDNDIIIEENQILTACDITVPNDISSAAYIIVLGIITKNSKITIKNIGLNPTRTGIIDILISMGANIKIENYSNIGEPVGDIIVESSTLKGVEISGSIIPRLIDEIPILAVAAAYASGTTTISDAGELKVKESNRIDSMVTELKKTGLDITGTFDGMIINGSNNLYGAEFDTYNDHRIAMALSIFSLAANGESQINNADIVGISYRNFYKTLEELTNG